MKKDSINYLKIVKVQYIFRAIVEFSARKRYINNEI